MFILFGEWRFYFHQPNTLVIQLKFDNQMFQFEEFAIVLNLNPTNNICLFVLTRY